MLAGGAVEVLAHPAVAAASDGSELTFGVGGLVVGGVAAGVAVNNLLSKTQDTKLTEALAAANAKSDVKQRELQAMIDRLTVESSSSKRAADAAKSSLKDKESELSAASSKLSSIQQEVADLKRQLSSAQSELATATKAASSAQAQLPDLEARLAEVSQKAAAADAELKRVQAAATSQLAKAAEELLSAQAAAKAAQEVVQKEQASATRARTEMAAERVKTNKLEVSKLQRLQP
jgi:chromosome segregation ATPase